MTSEVIIRSIKNREIKDIIGEVMEALNWKAIVPGNARVMIKPNLCTKRPELIKAANTSPAVVSTICKIIRERTSDIAIIESDGMRHTAEEVFRVNCIYQIADELGIKCLNLSKDTMIKVENPLLKGWGFSKAFLTTDVFITVPTLKTHAITVFSGALKNQWGCIPRNDRILLHRHLHRLISDINALRPPDISIMDATLGMEGMGPALGTSVEMNLILGSTDPVALDATAMRLVCLDPYSSEHIGQASKKGLGKIDKEDIIINGNFEQYKRRFKPAKKDFPVLFYHLLCRSSLFVKYLILNERRFERMRRFGIWFRKLKA